MPRAELYQKDRERCLRWKKAWDDRNRDKINSKARAYYASNKERIKAKSKEWHWANREVNNRRTKLWHQNNRARSAAIKSHAKHKRRALEYLTRVDDYAIRKWMTEIKKRPVAFCHWCGEAMMGLSVVFDHVFPIIKGGPHTLTNLCCACATCNSQKKDKLPSQWMKNGQTFLSL